MQTIEVGKKCLVIGCGKTAGARGLCGMHRKREDRHGTTDDSAVKTPPKGYINRKSHPLYKIWRNITRRDCGNQVCERWRDFKLFVEDVGDSRPEDYQFVRIDKLHPYSSENTRWQKIVRVNSPGLRKVRNSRMKLMRENNPDYFRNLSLRRRYGITLEEYQSILERQGGVCAICGEKESRMIRGKVTHLHVDHNHQMGTVRGLLCHGCNAAVGLLKEDLDIFRSAIKYLKRHN